MNVPERIVIHSYLVRWNFSSIGGRGFQVLTICGVVLPYESYPWLLGQARAADEDCEHCKETAETAEIHTMGKRVWMPVPYTGEERSAP